MPDFNAFIQNKVQSLHDLYRDESAKQQRLRLCLYGYKGSGKTTCACTGRKPVYLQSFEPGGTLVKSLQPLIAAGDVIVDTSWEEYDLTDSTVIERWINEMKELEKNGLFNHIGTFVCDSITFLAEYLMTNVISKDLKNATRTTAAPVAQLQNYVPFQSRLMNLMKCFVGYPCDMIMTGHIGKITDEVTGQQKTGLALIGEKSSAKITPVFSELWCMRPKSTSQGTEYELLTQAQGIYDACTRIGDGIFAPVEKPNITSLLERAGWDVTPKPSLLKGGADIGTE